MGRMLMKLTAVIPTKMPEGCAGTGHVLEVVSRVLEYVRQLSGELSLPNKRLTKAQRSIRLIERDRSHRLDIGICIFRRRFELGPYAIQQATVTGIAIRKPPIELP